MRPRCMCRFLAVLAARQQGTSPDSCKSGELDQTPAGPSRGPSESGWVLGGPGQEAILSFKADGFRGVTLPSGPCRPVPPSYMRLTVAISRAFDLWGFGLVRRQGPANLPQKKGYEDNGKGHWDRSRHHEFVRCRNGWQDIESHRERRGHADHSVDRCVQR